LAIPCFCASGFPDIRASGRPWVQLLNASPLRLLMQRDMPLPKTADQEVRQPYASTRHRCLTFNNPPSQLAVCLDRRPSSDPYKTKTH
jgi:hypothetical protein